MHSDELALIQGSLAATPHRHGARMHSPELAPIQDFLAATAHRHGSGRPQRRLGRGQPRHRHPRR